MTPEAFLKALEQKFTMHKSRVADAAGEGADRDVSVRRVVHLHLKTRPTRSTSTCSRRPSCSPCLASFTRVDVGSVIQQDPHRVRSAGTGGRHEHGLPFRARGVRVGPGLQQRGDDGRIAVAGGQPQRRDPVAVGRVGLAPARSSRSTIPASSARAAQCRAVVPSTWGTFGSARCLSRARTASTFRALTASATRGSASAAARVATMRHRRHPPAREASAAHHRSLSGLKDHRPSRSSNAASEVDRSGAVAEFVQLEPELAARLRSRLPNGVSGRCARCRPPANPPPATTSGSATWLCRLALLIPLPYRMIGVIEQRAVAVGRRSQLLQELARTGCNGTC